MTLLRRLDRLRPLRWMLFWWQRRTRGWDDSETWSLDRTLARYIAPRLRRFREVSCGYPCDMTETEWSESLSKMQTAFDRLMADECCCDFDPSVQEGLDLFAQHFRGLWW